MYKTKGFGYHARRDKDVIDYIDKQPNKSLYMWNLVRKDMKKQSIEDIVKNQIEKYLENLDIKPKDDMDEGSINPKEIINIMGM